MTTKMKIIFKKTKRIIISMIKSKEKRNDNFYLLLLLSSLFVFAEVFDCVFYNAIPPRYTNQSR